MKKILSLILTIILTISICGAYTDTQLIPVNAAKSSKENTDWPKGPDLYGTSAILMDASTGTVLYNKKADKKMYPASITKIMTALLTIENCELDEKVAFSAEAVNSLHYDDANFACQVGEEMSVKDCLYVLMLNSANEVATALGEHIAGSTKKFAEMMTERAKEAGALNTHFANANGLHDADHYVTAYDMAMITRAAAQHPLFNEIVNTTSYKVAKNNKRKTRDIAYQRHKMVWPTGSFYYEGAIGGKTGYTDQAGTTLVTYAERDGMTLIAVVLHSNGNNVYYDTKALFDYGFNNFKQLNVSQNDKRFSESGASLLQSPFSTETGSIYIDNSSTVVIPKDTDFSTLTSTVKFGLSDNSFATITYNLGKKSVGTANLKYEKTSFSENSADKVNTEKETTTDNNSKDTNEEATKIQSESSSKKLKINFKFSKKLVVILIVFVILIFIIILIIKQKRKINRIREAKRRRNRQKF